MILNAALAVTFSAAEGGAKLEVTYAVTGYLAAVMKTWAVATQST